MEDKQLTEHESLQLIQQMIDTAKEEQKDDGKGWIIWGWLIFSASLFTYFNVVYKWANTFYFWNLFGLATLVIFAVQLVRYFFIIHDVVDTDFSAYNSKRFLKVIF